jgi:protein-L-isoaspartate O-methyltransferase
MTPMKSLVMNSLGGDESLVDEDDNDDDDNEDEVYSTLDDYSSAYSSKPASIYNEFELNTAKLLPTGAHMVSGSIQGSLLTTLASMSREGRILEIGTFTGYATARLLEGATAAGTDKIGTLDGGGPFVLSLERDRRALALASAHLKVMTDHDIGDVGASGASRLRDTDSGASECTL